MMARFTTFITPKKINILDLFDCKGLSSSSAPRAIRDWLIPASRCPTMCLTSSAPSPRTRLAVRETCCIRSDDQISSLPTIRHALEKECLFLNLNLSIQTCQDTSNLGNTTGKVGYHSFYLLLLKRHGWRYNLSI